jgi:adenylate cyclase
MRRAAVKGSGEPLGTEDWAIVWALHHTPGGRVLHRLFAILPSSPRCCQCGAPFAGVGRLLTRPLGYRPSLKNPHYCATCVELSPPGGMTMDVGVMFADIRGFTSTSEQMTPEEVAALLRRFYGCAETVLFPEAILDKLMGDAVMALYLGVVHTEDTAPVIMLGHAHRLLHAVGYDRADGPFVAIGIGIDYGEAFVGNIGERAVHDFTAVGDVVNTAARLQAQAASGQIVYSARVAARLPSPPGRAEELVLPGKRSPEVAYRVSRPGRSAG